MILDEAPGYYSVLARARAGNLIFFAIVCAGVWLLARRCGEPATAAASVALCTLLAVVLDHAGMATTDVALAGCLSLAYWGCQRWLSHPEDVRLAAFAGFATGLAVLSKFSAILFLPAALLPLLLLWRVDRVPSERAAACAAAVFILVGWSAYRFALIPVRTPPGRQFLLLGRYIGNSGWLHHCIYRLSEIPLPLSAMVKGIGEVFQHNWDGHLAYLLGQVSQHGPWYFFPVVLAVKTPLAHAVLVASGAAFAIRDRNQSAVECLAACFMVLLVSLPSNIDIGVRYVLAVYVFSAPLAGAPAVRLWKWSRPAAAVLCGWLLACSIAAHPHYLADFNLLAGSRPERIVTDSDLDWGQDLRFATETLRRLGAREAWIAASVRLIYFEHAMARAHGKPAPYAWLEPLTPVARAGPSILIFDAGGSHP